MAPVHALLQKLKINASDDMARADAGSSYQLLLVKGVNRGFFLVKMKAKFKMKAGKVWDSNRGTPKVANPFHKGIPGIQTTNPNQHLQ